MFIELGILKYFYQERYQETFSNTSPITTTIDVLNWRNSLGNILLI